MKYFYVKTAVDLELLSAQINANIVINTVLVNLMWNGPSDLEVDFKNELASYEKDALDAIVSAHTVNPTISIIGKAFDSAVDFGQRLLKEYATIRMIRGTTDLETLQVLQQLQLVQSAMASGSLKAARLILLDMQPTALIPQSDIDYFLSKLNTYLGI